MESQSKGPLGSCVPAARVESALCALPLRPVQLDEGRADEACKEETERGECVELFHCRSYSFLGVEGGGAPSAVSVLHFASQRYLFVPQPHSLRLVSMSV